MFLENKLLTTTSNPQFIGRIYDLVKINNYRYYVNESREILWFLFLCMKNKINLQGW